MDDERYYIEDEDKVALLKDIIAAMISRSVGGLKRFAGQVKGTDMIVSFDIEELSASDEISRDSFPLVGESAVLSDVIRRAQKFSIISNPDCITIEFTINDYLIEERLDF